MKSNLSGLIWNENVYNCVMTNRKITYLLFLTRMNTCIF